MEMDLEQHHGILRFAKLDGAERIVNKGVEQLIGDDYDCLPDIVHDIDHLSRGSTFEFIEKLNGDATLTVIKLGGALSKLRESGDYRPYPNFRAMVEEQLRLSYSNGMRWIHLYEDLIRSTVELKKVLSLKWAALAEIAPVITPDNVNQWVEAGEKNTIVDLRRLAESRQRKVWRFNRINETLRKASEAVRPALKTAGHAPFREGNDDNLVVMLKAIQEIFPDVRLTVAPDDPL